MDSSYLNGIALAGAWLSTTVPGFFRFLAFLTLLPLFAHPALTLMGMGRDRGEWGAINHAPTGAARFAAVLAICRLFAKDQREDVDIYIRGDEAQM